MGDICGRVERRRRRTWAGGRFPPGPRGGLPGSVLLAVNRDLPGTLRSFARGWGDVAGFRLGALRAALLSHPDGVRDALVVRHRELVRGDAMRYLRKTLGEGLLTSSGQVHLKRRRLLQPAFHPDRVAVYGEYAIEYADRVSGAWHDGELLDVAEEMSRLSLLVAGRAMLNVDIEGAAHRIGELLPEVLAVANRALNPLAPVLDQLPLPSTLRFRAARAEMDQLVIDMIERRAAEGTDQGELLSLLLAARADGGVDGRAGALTAREVQGEAMTMLLAGHETVASALAWTFYLLARNPRAEQRLHEEVDTVLAGRGPVSADTARLPYTRQVVTESMRLMPPVPAMSRQTVADYQVGEHVLPRGCTVVLSPAVTHYDPRYFPDPERFLPERWTSEFRTGLPRHAYFPFAAGPHQCIGEGMAWTECVLAIAAVAARWRLCLEPGRSVGARTQVTLRPKNGLWMRAEARMRAHR